MALVRRVLGRIALSWVVAHASAILLSPVAVLLATAEAQPECTCAHGDHAICPMHHAPKPGSRTCVVQASGTGDVAALSPLFAGVGMPVSPASTTPLEPVTVGSPTELAATTQRPVPPDPPPPRA